MTTERHLSRNFDTVRLIHPIVLVLGMSDNQRGHLFEIFIGKLLTCEGYEQPTRASLNVSANGIELDITARHILTGHRLVAECKAYSTNVRAKELTNFYGKLTTERFEDPNVIGLFVAIPGLVAEGNEKLSQIKKHDQHFIGMSSLEVFTSLARHQIIEDQIHQDEVASDIAVVITEHGVYTATKVLDPITRKALFVRCWGKSPVPDPVVELLKLSDYSFGLSVHRVSETATLRSRHVGALDQTLITVAGSTHDFEYQLPASPQFFVGRRDVLRSFREMLRGDVRHGTVIVLNGQSGWGKSSLALRLSAMTHRSQGVAIVFDSRTAFSPDYVTASLTKAILLAFEQQIAIPPDDESFASIASCLDTLRRATWGRGGPLLIFYDQFENVFRSPVLTREFRDLALSVREVECPLIIGFSWKTDFVAWAEGYPYHLRDEIRSQAELLHLLPFGPGDINTLLRRIEKAASTKLQPELKRRLREYSQGLPWLFKKLASHVIKELLAGASQTDLLEEALNVKKLFESDVAELAPAERTALHQIARLCPALIGEIVELIPSEIIQSLLDRRLIVSLGEFVDTYWDIFRDFLTTGEIPIKESYILRQTPSAVSKLLRITLDSGGDLSVASAATRLATSDGVIFNLSRQLRQMGVLVDTPQQVKITADILAAQDVEEAVRYRISKALRRNRAFSTLEELAEKSDLGTTVPEFASALREAFPAVQGSDRTWATYARAFLRWFEYARLCTFHRGAIRLGAPQRKTLELLDASSLLGRSRVPTKFPESAPRPALEVAKYLAGKRENPRLSAKASAKAFNDLQVLGIASYDARKGELVLNTPEIFDNDGRLDSEVLLNLLLRVPGASSVITTLMETPTLGRDQVGVMLQNAFHKEWSKLTRRNAGTYFRGWAAAAGIRIERSNSVRSENSPTDSGTLFRDLES